MASEKARTHVEANGFILWVCHAHHRAFLGIIDPDFDQLISVSGGTRAVGVKERLCVIRYVDMRNVDVVAVRNVDVVVVRNVDVVVVWDVQMVAVRDMDVADEEVHRRIGGCCLHFLLANLLLGHQPLLVTLTIGSGQRLPKFVILGAWAFDLHGTRGRGVSRCGFLHVA